MQKLIEIHNKLKLESPEGKEAERKIQHQNNNLILGLALTIFFWEKAPASPLIKLAVLFSGGITCFSGYKLYGLFNSQGKEAKYLNKTAGSELTGTQHFLRKLGIKK